MYAKHKILDKYLIGSGVKYSAMTVALGDLMQGWSIVRYLVGAELEGARAICKPRK